MHAYAVVTPARDEAANLPRLAASLAAQTVPPSTWVIVVNGSTDGTENVANRLAAGHPWVRVVALPAAGVPLGRGAPVVRALNAGIRAVDVLPEFVVNVDADVSMDTDYFEQLLAKFEHDSRLGIASGSAFELQDGAWRQRYVTGSTVWGATRAFRRECLQAVLPFEERIAWDGVDELKANALGWRTAAFEELPFRHHRPEGARDGSPWRARSNQGRAAYYLGYRAWYLALRSLWHARREPSALGMVAGYAAASVARAPRLADEQARAYLRRQQSLGQLARRAREAAGGRRRSLREEV